MKYLFILVFVVSLRLTAQEDLRISAVLDNWHKAAAQAQYNEYFNLMTSDAIFVGTDAKEHWDLPTFKAFAKPYFDKGNAWQFTPVERHIYISEDGKTAWFDELLNTWMKICRGSGVLRKEKNTWKIAHYVLSMTIPNEQANEVIKIKSDVEQITLDQLNKP